MSSVEPLDALELLLVDRVKADRASDPLGVVRGIEIV